MSGATRLAQLQAEFAACLLNEACPAGFDDRAAVRFQVYRNNLHHGLGTALAEAYPAVRRLVGPEFFAGMARAYTATHPPRERTLALYGDRFPAFVAGFPPAAGVPYLADVAALERAVLQAMHAADAPPLKPEALAALGAALATARFEPHPATRLVRSAYPVADLWRANRDEAVDAGRSFALGAAAALVTRPHQSVEVEALTPDETALVAALLQGSDVAEAYGLAGDAIDVTAVFARLLTAGAFARAIVQESGG